MLNHPGINSERPSRRPATSRSPTCLSSMASGSSSPATSSPTSPTGSPTNSSSPRVDPEPTGAHSGASDPQLVASGRELDRIGQLVRNPPSKPPFKRRRPRRARRVRLGIPFRKSLAACVSWKKILPRVEGVLGDNCGPLGECIERRNLGFRPPNRPKRADQLGPRRRFAWRELI